MIVESPAKAKTIAGYLGDEFVVESSVGHIRDLPERAADIPEQYKGEQWARLGVNVDRDFEPLYIVDPDKRKKVSELKKLLASSDELLLATDEDREGEAIAWHLLQVLKPKVPVKRMVFHEITRDAIDQALARTRDVDQRLVDAQETRRILDRLYGYEVSPVLWKKIMRGLSAGRVQSVATRLVVERERERMAFAARTGGTSRRRSTRSRSPHVSCRSTVGGSPSAATSAATVRCGRRTRCSSTRRRRVASRHGSSSRRSGSPASSASRTRAGRARPS